MPHAIRSMLQRAAFGAVYLAPGPEYSIRARMLGTVWPTLFQTPQAAEHVAYCVAVQSAAADTDVIGDSLSTVKEAALPSTSQVHPKRMYAGVLRSALLTDMARGCRRAWYFLEPHSSCQA